MLEQTSVVRRVVAADFARYELTEDLTKHHRLDLIGVCASFG